MVQARLGGPDTTAIGAPCGSAERNDSHDGARKQSRSRDRRCRDGCRRGIRSLIERLDPGAGHPAHVRRRHPHDQHRRRYGRAASPRRGCSATAAGRGSCRGQASAPQEPARHLRGHSGILVGAERDEDRLVELDSAGERATQGRAEVRAQIRPEIIARSRSRAEGVGRQRPARHSRQLFEFRRQRGVERKWLARGSVKHHPSFADELKGQLERPAATPPGRRSHLQRYHRDSSWEQ